MLVARLEVDDGELGVEDRHRPEVRRALPGPAGAGLAAGGPLRGLSAVGASPLGPAPGVLLAPRGVLPRIARGLGDGAGRAARAAVGRGAAARTAPPGGAARSVQSALGGPPRLAAGLAARAAFDRGIPAASGAQAGGAAGLVAPAAAFAADSADGSRPCGRRRASPRPSPSRTSPARAPGAPRRTARTRCAPPRTAPSRSAGTVPRRGVPRPPGGSARARRPLRVPGPCAASRPPGASRRGRGWRGCACLRTARTCCVPARAGACRTSGKDPGRHARRYAGDGGPGRRADASRCTARTG